MKKVVVVATGGTIAGVSNGSGYDSGIVSVDQLLKVLPDFRLIATIETAQSCNVGSQDMNFLTLQKVAIEVQSILDRSDVDGIVITHGTDTMEESAFFLNLVVQSSKPIVFTGAMKPSTAIDSDGPANLLDAIRVAVSHDSFGRGVLLVMHRVIHCARAFVKSHTTSVDTFISPENGPVGHIIADDTISFEYDTPKVHTYLSNFHRGKSVILPRIDIFYGCTDMNSDLIRSSVSLGAQGIVIAGVGNGNVNEAVLGVISELTRQGIPVVRGSRVPMGKIVRNLEIDDDSVGTLVADSLAVAKSRVLLMVAVGIGIPLTDLQQIFYDY